MCSVLLSTALLVATIQDPAALQRRLAQVDALRHRASVVAARGDSARQEQLDTIRAGALVILARRLDADRVRRGAEIAWRQLDSLYGDEAATLAARPMMFWFVQRDGHPRALGMGRFLAEHITGATYVELAGEDQWPWAGDADAQGAYRLYPVCIL